VADRTEILKAFLAEYEQYALEVLRPTRNELRDLLGSWCEPDYWAKKPRARQVALPSPVQSSKTRIKRPESVVDKILRHPEWFPDGLAFPSIRAMTDVLGGRVIVYFLVNLPHLDHEIR